jgi:hypothetical protein
MKRASIGATSFARSTDGPVSWPNTSVYSMQGNEPPLAIPLDRALSSSTTGVAQQIEISAAHQRQPRRRQSDRATTKVVRLPGGAGRNTSLVEEGFGNLAIGRTGQMTIESAERKQELLTLRPREAIGWSSGAPACQEPPEAQSRIGARSKIWIERVHRRDRRVNLEGARSSRGRRPPTSPTIQYSPSLARRLKIGVSKTRDREREKASVAGTSSLSDWGLISMCQQFCCGLAVKFAEGHRYDCG